MFQVLKDWAWAHPLLYPFILFVLACLVEIYGKDIRSFLHEWPRTKARAHKVKENDLCKRLVVLKALHNDSYQLILYLMNKCLMLIIEWFATAVIASVILVALHYKIEAIISYLIGVSLGIFTGMFYDVRKVINELIEYDESVTKLQKTLDELRAREVGEVDA